MLDIKWMRENRVALAEAMEKLNATDAPWERALELDEQRRQILTRVEALRAERNSGSKDVGALMRDKKIDDANALKARMSQIGEEITTLDKQLSDVESEFNDAMLRIPNPPEPDVPVALDEHPRCQQCVAAAPGTKISGARFYLLRGAGARLQRALTDFFLDVHVAEHGYEEIYPPFMVQEKCMVGTGNLPKFGENLYRDAEEDYWFIPTAEVPVTNIREAADQLCGTVALFPPREDERGQGCARHQACSSIPKGGDGQVCRATSRT